MVEIKPIDAVEAKPGRYVIFDGHACVVKSLEISRPGKHGHAKCRIEAIGLKDDKKIRWFFSLAFRFSKPGS